MSAISKGNDGISPDILLINYIYNHYATIRQLKQYIFQIQSKGIAIHAQASMVTERYAHNLDDERRMNAERFQKQFYSGPADEEPAAQPDPLQQLDAGERQTLLVKLLAESPEMAAMIKTMAQAM